MAEEKKQHHCDCGCDHDHHDHDCTCDHDGDCDCDCDGVNENNAAMTDDGEKLTTAHDNQIRFEGRQ